MYYIALISIVSLVVASNALFAFAGTVSAESESYTKVMTTVHSRAMTGGNGADGGRGTDGEDGKDGVDGKDGKDGAPGRVVQGTSRSEVRITSVIDGMTVVDETHMQEGEEGVSAHITATATDALTEVSISSEFATSPPVVPATQNEEDVQVSDETEEMTSEMYDKTDETPASNPFFAPVKVIISLFTKFFSYVGGLFS